MPRGTSFVDIQCHEGFHCISAVDVFGRGHDGKYKGLPVGSPVPVRFRGAYESGCPARGEMTNSGDCRDFGKGPVNHCWSNSRYETGSESSPCKDPSMCMCVKESDNGTSVQTTAFGEEIPNKSAESLLGQDLKMKTYLVQPEAKCQDCASHYCDRLACNACKNCEYAEKTIMGRRSKGCFFRDSGVAMKERVRSTDGRKYLFAGMEGVDSKQEEQKLVVIPHYTLWNPGFTRMGGEVGGAEDHPANELRTPYENRSEPMSREAWIDGYKSAAPRIQRSVDTTAQNIKEWGPKANDIDCTQDIEGRLVKSSYFLRECRTQQALEQHLAPNTPFEPNVPDSSGGFIPVKCGMGGQGMCAGLNCYANDVDLLKGIDQFNERAKTCRKAMGMLVSEEEQNGPIAPDAEVSSKSGGRLEIALPPAGVGYEGEPSKDAMPVEDAIAQVAQEQHARGEGCESCMLRKCFEISFVPRV